MATTGGSAAPNYTHRTLAYVAIPLATVVAIGLIASVFHAKSRRRLLSNHGQYLGPNAGERRVLERDLQEVWTRGAPQYEHQQRPGVGRWSRNANGVGRWAWAREFLSARNEEGLNEFGEAPPPYEGNSRQGKIEEEGGAVELAVRPAGSGSSSGAGTGGGRVEEPEPRQTADRQWRSSAPGLPPAYDGPPTVALGTSPVAEPPQALTHGSRPGHPST